VQLGIITNATAQRINRDLNPVEAAAWAESVIGDAFTGALAAQEVRLLDLVAATDGRPTAAQINSFWRREDDFLWGSVQSSVETVAQERAIVAALTGVADDKTWNKINDAVLNWVGDYYTNLDVDLVGSIPNLNATGRTEFARSFIDWQRGELETAGAQDGLPQLIRAIEPTFGQARAARIAATETTRIFYEATYQAANANPNVTAFRWYSAADERVCFPEGTQVSTSTGDVSIETIKPGDYVLTRGGYRKVAAASARPYQGAMSTVITRNGAVTATSDHPFWTLEQGWLQCGDLTTSHTLQTFNDQSVNITGVVNFRVGDTANYPTVGFKQFDLAGISLGVLMPVNSIDFEGNILVYDLQVEDDHEFYANGILVHNCSICGPNHLVVVPKAQRIWPNGATIPAHPNCRCRAIEETALTLETPLPREERYRWSAENYANYQAEQAAARRPTNIIDTLTG
jgi:hypothetical protein